jgi:hypothetical protein
MTVRIRCAAKHPVWGRCHLAHAHGMTNMGGMAIAHCVILETRGRRTYQRWADGIDWPEPPEARHLALPWAIERDAARRGPRLNSWAR